MRVLLLGGYGVFGERLARLLVRDGHTVTIAGRSLEKASVLAQELGCTALWADRAGRLPDLASFDVLVDAAGPFDAAVPDPYYLALAAIGGGVHYLDLSDNAAFCAGISALDADARAAGVCISSGLSSVPAISSAAGAALAGGNLIQLIETAILPGNRSPRGPSVMTSILSQAGMPMQIWRHGKWDTVMGWSEPRDYSLQVGLVRQGWLIEVPDNRLFPDHFKAETVVFRAGLELGVMRYGLRAFALLRSRLPIPVTPGLVRAFKLAADLLAPFGTGKGGMSVNTITDKGVRRWTLVAEDGDGPFVPAVPVRALLRRKRLPIGAGPAVCLLDLAEIEDALSDLCITTKRTDTAPIGALTKAPGYIAEELPTAIRATHEDGRVRSVWNGTADIETGSGLLARAIRWAFSFPPAGKGVPVQVEKIRDADSEVWTRTFGNSTFRSRMTIQNGHLVESFGPLHFRIGLETRDGALHYPVSRGWLWGMPLPRWLLPVSRSREISVDGDLGFDVTLHLVIMRSLVVRYSGKLG